MASTSQFSNRYQARASSSKQPVQRSATSNAGLPSVDVVYQIVWTVTEPPLRPSSPSDDPGKAVASPRRGPSIPQGSIRISGPATDDSIWKEDEPASTQQETPSIEYESPYAPWFPPITGPAADDGVWRQGEPIPTPDREQPIDYSPQYPFRGPRYADSAIDRKYRMGDEPSHSYAQRLAMEFGYNLSPRAPGSAGVTDSALNNNTGRAGEPSSSRSQRPSIVREFSNALPPRIPSSVRTMDPAVNNNTSMAGESSSSSSRFQRPSIDMAAAKPPYSLSSRSPGNIHTTGPSADSRISSKPQPQTDTQSPPIPQPTSAVKIPCMAKLHLDTLGALSTCSYDTATDSFSNFSVSDAAWGQRKGYRDYGEVQISTRKWVKGSWVEVKDDSGNGFLFVTVDRDHGLVRDWRPNLVAKRVVGFEGGWGLTDGEFARLGCGDDDRF